MKRIINICILVIALIFISTLSVNALSNELMDSIMDSWVGYSIDDVIDQWGYPYKEKKIAGRKLFYWRKKTYVSGHTFYCYRVLETDKNLIVKKWEWSGGDCPFAPYSKYKSEWQNSKPKRTYQPPSETKTEVKQKKTKATTDNKTTKSVTEEQNKEKENQLQEINIQQQPIKINPSDINIPNLNINQNKIDI